MLSFMRKAVPVLVLFLECFTCVWGAQHVYAVDFRVSNPIDRQEEAQPDRVAGETSSRNHDSDFSRVFKISTDLGSERNYYELAAIVDTNKLMLDSGDIVHLVGLISGEEIVARKKIARASQAVVGDPVDIIKDFMAAYLSDKKMKVRFSDMHGVDESGHPYAYVSVVDDGLFNEVLVRYGYGMVSSAYYFPESYAFSILQSEAQYDESGIWRAFY